jgi:diguanylate cyclase (GGDEF)-like protein/PAS domain S-box-containing protein
MPSPFPASNEPTDVGDDVKVTVSNVEQSVAQLSSLVESLGATSPLPRSAIHDNRLVEVRLGIASSLFIALRQRHSETAAHSLRVALGCSAWGFMRGLDCELRDELEVAALLHDIGKIGVPDRLLLKPGRLEHDEAQLMDQFRLSGLDILSTCCPSQLIVDAIRHSAGWFDGSRHNYPLAGDGIPMVARMLAIVDAFDSMTSDQVYRQAMSRERALNELFKCAGSQFDSELVNSFSELPLSVHAQGSVASHWLQTLHPQRSNRFWRCLAAMAPIPPEPTAEMVFQQKLLDNMHDAVIFVDENLHILQWNRGAERLTGLGASGVVSRSWSPALIGMRDEGATSSRRFDCPIAYCIGSGIQSLKRLQIAGRDGRPISVDAHTVPVVGPNGKLYGAAMLLHDASPEASLEARCQNLHERATKDPLTQVANRAEFDRTYAPFIQAHLERRLPCSLIICDIDRFKSINDTFGHQAGDEVLKFFGQLLKTDCRQGDLVARYGGEEFVMLCADCANAAAARRAEQLRKTVSDLPQPAVNGNTVTVSFGVTEIQPGDTADSMLRRADRALFEAKRMGRNMVVQLGGGLGDPDEAAPQAIAPAHCPGSELFLERVLVTAVPLNIAVEKLRGFVLDHHVEILSIKADRIDLQIETHGLRDGRRRSDRGVPFLVELTLAEQRIPIVGPEGRGNYVSRTRVRVSIRLKRARDRRSANVAEQASSILWGLQSYLMANEEVDPVDPATTRRAVNVLGPWLKPRG